MIKITNEDNMQLMSRYEDNHFDLAIVDPPYGIGEAGKNHKSRNTLVRQKGGQLRRCPSTNYKRKNWDDKPADSMYFNQLKSSCVHWIVFGANYFKDICGIVFKTPRRKDFTQFIKDNPIGWIIWDKVNGDSDFNDCELIRTSFNNPSIILKYMWAGMMQGKGIVNGTIMQGNKKLNEKRIHPTQKPVKLYEWLLMNYAKEGDKILDTHLGSGSIAIACHNLGYDLTACELDKDYYDAAMKRLKQHQAQLTMF